jgi:hypothetical protein
VSAADASYPVSDAVLRPTTDNARKVMLETLIHGFVSVSVIASATVLSYVGRIDSAAWAAALGAGIAASGAVSVLQARTGNGHIAEEALAQIQRPGGRRRTDPPLSRQERHKVSTHDDQ